MSDPTNDQIQTAIAKHKGWEWQKFLRTFGGTDMFVWFPPDGGMRQPLPDWPTDIAAAMALADEAGFVVGPEWSGGARSVRVGWAVYKDWIEVSYDVYSENADAHALAIDASLPRAIAMAYCRLNGITFEEVKP